MDNMQHKPETPEQRREAEARILRKAAERPMGAGWVSNQILTRRNGGVQHQFVRHVLTVGGVGDLSDCRTFLDPKIRESRRKAQTNQEAA